MNLLPARDAPVALAGGTQDEAQVHFYFPEIVRDLGFGWQAVHICCWHILATIEAQ